MIFSQGLAAKARKLPRRGLFGVTFSCLLSSQTESLTSLEHILTALLSLQAD